MEHGFCDQHNESVFFPCSISGYSSNSSHSDTKVVRLSRRYWLFSAPVDLAAFAGSAAVALSLLWLGSALGVLHSEAPDWTWVTAVLLVDVAHVYATGFRVCFDPAELRRRPWLYALTPLLGFVIGWALYSEAELLFWRTLAYLAVFHFVRQQYGWVALYRARVGETGWQGKLVDSAAIYLATIYPLIYWHAHLPRHFWWFLAHDFVALPVAAERLAAPLYWGALGLYAARSLYRGVMRHELNPGKDIVVVTTAVCWYVGIVTFNSDYAFTVTNVIIHGVPYFVLVFWYVCARRSDSILQDDEMQRGRGSRRAAVAGESLDYGSAEASPSQWQQPRLVPIAFRPGRFAGFIATLWLAAYVEELFWDKSVWHTRSWLFGRAWDVGLLKSFLVPLLAVPQITHYILDGFLWRRGSRVM